MKKTKLFLSVLIAAVLLFSLCAPVFADSAPVLEIGKNTAEPGKTVTVTVTLANNPGITYLRVTPKTDSSAFTLTSVSNGNLFPTLDEGLNLVFSADSEVKANGVLCELTFAVSEEAELNSTVNISLTVRECYNDSYGEINIEALDGRISIGCSHAETTDTVIFAPTCTQNGQTRSVCNACGWETTLEAPAIGHTEGEWETTKAPAVGVAGEMAVKCAVCNETVKTQIIPALSGEGGGQGDTPSTPATPGCGGGGATAAISVFFTAILPAFAAVLLKRLFF